MGTHHIERMIMGVANKFERNCARIIGGSLTQRAHNLILCCESATHIE